jgi:carbonic anhydrase
MDPIKRLLANNRSWAERVTREDPSFFRRLRNQQSPEFLWIGCADSRVPANEIVGLPPGELFVHRNIANVVVPSDLNAVSVIQFGVDVLRVKHIIVCGHYGCSGVRAAQQEEEIGLADNWLLHVRAVRDHHEAELAALPDEESRFDRLCELNVREQMQNLAHTTPVQRAWRLGQELTIHGWIYSIADGLLHDLELKATSRDEAHGIRTRRTRKKPDR